MFSSQHVDEEGYNQLIALVQTDKDFDFYKPNLEEYKPPRFPGPENTPQIVEVLQKRRLSILGGGEDINKVIIARHVAWYLCDKLEHDMNSANGSDNNMQVLEWSGTESVDLGLSIKTINCPTVFILPQLSPYNINHDLRNIWEYSIKGNHYIIVSTEVPFSVWRMSIEETILSPVWIELSIKELYSTSKLKTVLYRKLIEVKNILPREVIENARIRTRIGGVDLSVIVEELKTPENIADFIQLLCMETEGGVLDKDIVTNLIRIAQDDTSRLRQLYYSLSHLRDQLLVIGLGLFDNLPEDLFFAVLDEVIENVWQRRETSLRAVDYCDFDKLHSFFEFANMGTQGMRVKSRRRDQRRRLFEIAWNSHRRHIIATLPILVQFVQNSVLSKPLNWEMYGTQRRRDQLRQVISETISDLGLISIAVIEDTLLRMAIDKHIGVQAVTARAMARWRNYECHERLLFETIQRWLNDVRVVKVINNIFQEPDDERNEQPHTYLRATLALTVGYAAQTDAPNQLPVELYKLFRQLSCDSNMLVRSYMCSYVLPMVLPKHLKQLRSVIRDMTKYNNLQELISKRIADAYQKNPIDTQETLNAWYENCLKTRSTYAYKTKPNSYQKLLATVALSYGEIQYSTEDNGFTANEAFQRMRTILAEVRHPFVREAVMDAVIRLSPRYFTYLQDLVHEVKDSERNKIVDRLTEIFLDQLKHQQEYETRIRVNGSFFPFWIDLDRPITTVEGEMQNWVKKKNNSVAQKIAVRALVAFVYALTELEKDLVRQSQQRLKQAGLRERAFIESTFETVTTTKYGFYIEHLVPWISTWGAGRYRLIIQGVLPEIIEQYHSNPKIVKLLLQEKWQILNDNDLPVIARRLQCALFLINNPWIVFSVFGMILSFFGFLLYVLL